MKRCPNCGRATARTKDWACQWCGYPLLGGGYKVIDKTFRELKEEREAAVRSLPHKEEPVVEPRPAPVVEARPEPPPVKPEPPPVPPRVFRPEPAPEVEPVRQPEPKTPEPQPAPRAIAGPAPAAVNSEPAAEAVKPTPASESEPATQASASPVSPPPRSEPVTEAKPPVVEVQPQAAAQSPAPPPLPAAEPVPEAKPAPTLESLLTQSDLTIDELYTALVAYSTAADDKYKGRVLRVTGMIYRTVVNVDLDVRYLILTSATKFKEWQVTCTFDKEHGQGLNQMKVGETVTVQGKYDGYGANVLMRDCSLV
ncbi:MAG: hypothetical protein Q8O05_03685 [Chloroflexota bacterium]|nr:hypothetical protein [Chloroflexota bacterium]